MSDPTANFKINLNQNLWGLVVALTTLGLSEHYKLCVLFWFAVILSSAFTLSVLVTTLAYTIGYWNAKQ